MRDADCIDFLQWALPELGMRWAGFRKVRRQVCRRLEARRRELGLSDLAAYRRRLAEDAGEWRVLDSLCRVTISRFFRDRGVFETLRTRILPELAADAERGGRAKLGAWSAGCASGEEPYSLRLLWDLDVGARFAGLELEIVATDTDPHLLERARRAVYPAGSLREVPDGWRARAFDEREGMFRLRAERRTGVELRHQDVRETSPSGSFDLVLCRNLVFTYFTEEVQRMVLARIGASLRPGGVLVVGSHERLPEGVRGWRSSREPAFWRTTPS